MKKIGWESKSRNFFNFLFNQKLVHIVVILAVFLLVSINLTAKTKAGSLTEKASQTILSDLVSSEFNDAPEDEQFIEESFDQELTITPIQQKYLDELSNIKAQPQASINETDEANEDMMPTIQEGATIVKPDIASTKITKRPRTKTISYIVKPGDTVSTIAEEFDISVSTILWENSLTAYSIIRPGDSLSILPMNGINHKVAKGENLGSLAKKYAIDEAAILEANKLADAGAIQIGQLIFIPGGKKIFYPEYKPSTYSGIAALRDIIKSPSAKPVKGNKMNWPTVGHRITQYFTWRHYAVDIANKIGTPIYAADSGVVEYIGWGKGYGNQIVIDHGGGKKTRYAHLSKFSCSKGEKISKGETIGKMGSTGWSTGSHLHFEIIIEGKKYNPLNYIR